MSEQRDAEVSLADSQKLGEPTDDTVTKSVEKSLQKSLTGVWEKTTASLQRLFGDQLARTVVKWFSVSEAEIANILETVRAELPTTEALLLGKPQAGKSSIVRGLTGVSAEIVGQGFRPHTQHTQRYAYPSNDVPLLIFKDTVGLGDVKQETQVIIQELIGEPARGKPWCQNTDSNGKNQRFCHRNTSTNHRAVTSAVSRNSLFVSSNLFA